LRQLKEATQRSNSNNFKRKLKQLQEETQTTSRGNSNNFKRQLKPQPPHLLNLLSLLTFSTSSASSPSAIANDLTHKLVG
jgi:hypothetical protein